MCVAGPWLCQHSGIHFSQRESIISQSTFICLPPTSTFRKHSPSGHVRTPQPRRSSRGTGVRSFGWVFLGNPGDRRRMFSRSLVEWSRWGQWWGGRPDGDDSVADLEWSVPRRWNYDGDSESSFADRAEHCRSSTIVSDHRPDENFSNQVHATCKHCT